MPDCGVEFQFEKYIQAMWSGGVCKKESEMDESTLAIHKLNQHIHNDQRVDCSLITTGDGVNIAVKK
jgi:predicted O-methyltransferase YrrM